MHACSVLSTQGAPRTHVLPHRAPGVLQPAAAAPGLDLCPSVSSALSPPRQHASRQNESVIADAIGGEKLQAKQKDAGITHTPPPGRPALRVRAGSPLTVEIEAWTLQGALAAATGGELAGNQVSGRGARPRRRRATARDLAACRQQLRRLPARDAATSCRSRPFDRVRPRVAAASGVGAVLEIHRPWWLCISTSRSRAISCITRRSRLV